MRRSDDSASAADDLSPTDGIFLVREYGKRAGPAACGSGRRIAAGPKANHSPRLRPPLSPAAGRLLHDVIVSSTRLDALLLLRSEPARWWSVDLVAATLRVSAPSAGQALEGLGLGKLLDVRVGEALAYRFAPVDSKVSDTIAEIAALHYVSRDALLAALPGVGKSASAARRIADAFRMTNRERHE